jgi:phosphoketolase
MSDAELTSYFTGAGGSPRIVDVTAVGDPDGALAEILDAAHAGAAELRRRSYRPEELFDETGRPVEDLLGVPPARELRVRVVNIVDLLTLAPRGRHPRGMTEDEFTALFGTDVPVVFAFHGYPSAVHEVLHGRTDPNRFHVHGYLEEGTTTTPYDLLVANAMSRHDLAAHAVSLAERWSSQGGDIADDLLRDRDELVAHAYRTGADEDAFTEWRWTS